MIAFDKIKAMLGDVISQDKDFTHRIEKAEEKIKEIESAPLTKADYLTHGLTAIDSMAAGYHSQLQQQADNDCRRDPLDFSTPGFFTGLAPGGFTNAQAIQPAALCALLGPVLKEQYRAAVERLEWPAKCGLPLSERVRQIAGLKTEIADLQRQQQELRQEATESGLQLGIMSEDPSTLSLAQRAARSKALADEAGGKLKINVGA